MIPSDAEQGQRQHVSVHMSYLQGGSCNIQTVTAIFTGGGAVMMMPCDN